MAKGDSGADTGRAEREVHHGKCLELIKLAAKLSKNARYDSAAEALRGAYIEDKVFALPYLLEFRKTLTRLSKEGHAAECLGALKKAYLISARDRFDDFCIYTEWDRPPEQKFYAPRRPMLKKVVDSLQDMADDVIDILCISMPPGTGKSGLAIFFLCWLAGRDPSIMILSGSHNTAFLRGVYDECLRELDPNGEYLWKDVFPTHEIVKTNAQDMRIDIDKARRFSTFQFSSVGSGNAGKVRANFLYCDDLIEGIEEAISAERLEKKWQLYSTDLRQRKQGSGKHGLGKELHLSTRWSVHDIIGRLQREYENNKRVRFIVVPALDENGKSNFDYGGANGFTTEFYNDLMSTMDDASWKALYMNQPIEREGLLYEESCLRYYYQLPEGEPDAIMAVCDTAEGGGDDTVMPIFAVYGNDHYMIDCVCSDALPEVTDGLCAEALLRNKVKMCQFESNSAGGRTADKVEEIVRKESDIRGIRACSITKKRTLANKETKILVNSAFIKEHCLFKDKKIVQRGSPYASFMRKLCEYSVAGKNKHDDVPDALAQYALFTENLAGSVVQVMKRPF